MKKLVLKAFSAGAALLLLICPESCRATTVLDDGIRSYQSGQYIKALDALDRAVSDDRGNALAYYYRANTLLYLNQHDDAMDDYRRAYTLAPAHSKIAGYCLAALLADEQARAQEESKAINRQLLRDMVTKIQEEIAQQKTRLDLEAQQHSAHRARLGDIEQERIKAQADRDLEDLANNPIPVVVGRRVIYVPRTEEMRAVREKAASDLRYARESTERSIRQARDSAVKRQVELEKSAVNLERQFVHPDAGGVRLQVLGTNLYVRNYVLDSKAAQDQDENLPAPLLAKAKRLKYIPHPPGKGEKAHAGELPGGRVPPHSGEKAAAHSLPGGSSDLLPAASFASGKESSTTARVRGRLLNPRTEH